MTYKEYINKKIKTGMNYYSYAPVILLLISFIGFAVTKNNWFIGAIFISLFIIPTLLSWNLRKNLKCPVCKSLFTEYLETKMIHWNRNSFEWNSCPKCSTDYNEKIKKDFED